MIHLRPSSSYRWTRCAASPTFEGRSAEQAPSDAAREGTCAAWVADSVLKSVWVTAADMVGLTHENGWLVTPDMAHHVQKYIDLIRSFGGSVAAEQFVRLTDFIAGTFDTSVVGSMTSNVLRIIDLKYGVKIVEVFNNTQVIIYAGAELIRLGHPASITHVELGIYQPRAFHPDGIYRTWTLTVADLWRHVEWIVDRGNACQVPNPVATPGPQCDYCRATTSCAALAMSNYRNYSIIEDDRQRHMTTEELTAELNFLDDAARILKARKSAVETEATERMKLGEHVSSWVLENGKGNRKFDVDPLVVLALTGVNPYGEPTTVTPAELERRGANPDVVECLTSRPNTGFKLKRMSENYIEKAFSK